MDDRDLTLQEFWKLSKEERGKRYAELSAHDRFAVRVSMDSGTQSVLCNSCRYYMGFAKCKAYPNGIPSEHIDRVEADTATACGDGYRYEPKGK